MDSESAQPGSRPETGLAPAALFAQALDHFEHGRYQAASQLLAQALAAEPGNAALWNLAGVVARASGQIQDAEHCWRSAITLKPDGVEAHYNLGGLLHGSKRFVEAESAYRGALAHQPRNVSALNNLGATLEGQGRLDEALQCYEQAVAINPDHAKAHHNLGIALNALGRSEEARQALDTALVLAADKAPYYRSLAYSRRFSRGDAQLRAMEELAQNMATLSPGDRMQLHFALGKVYGDIGEHQRSFSHLLAGNAEKRRSIAYDEAATLASFDRTRIAYSAELMATREGTGHPSNAPIFILGMPRSGSSLVEQILASHPGVYGAGECDDFERLADAIRIPDRGPLLPDGIAGLSAAALRQLGTDYCAGLKARAGRADASAATHITDKTPRNYLYVGLIHLALPAARIIHTQRDPVDTCLSCFSQLFNGDHPYAYDLSELGRYWCACDELMTHWRSVLPTGVMLEIRYEELVDDLEGQARRLLAHCGLEWDDACLAFHKTRRPVRTASATQVRQPIYRTSVQRWRVYGELLQPLLDSLSLRAPRLGEEPPPPP